MKFFVSVKISSYCFKCYKQDWKVYQNKKYLWKLHFVLEWRTIKYIPNLLGHLVEWIDTDIHNSATWLWLHQSIISVYMPMRGIKDQPFLLLMWKLLLSRIITNQKMLYFCPNSPWASSLAHYKASQTFSRSSRKQTTQIPTDPEA